MEYANFIARCIEIARRGEYFVAPNPMVGAVLVRNSDEQILAEGWHERYGEGHAEVNCFKAFENSAFSSQLSDLSDCTLFVSLEPCSHYGKTPPCAKLIIEKGVGRVVVGMLDPNPLVAGKGVQMLRDAGIEVVIGVLEKECRELNKRFLCLHEKHRPYVILKWAQTADGFLDDHGQAVAVSTPLTRMLVHQLRAEYEAIVVGRVTEEREHPQLNVRYWSGPNPVKMVLSRSFGMEQVIAACREQGLQSLMVEGGGITLRSFIDAGLWDEIRVETGCCRVGGGTPAPEVPSEAVLLSEEVVDGNRIARFARR